jgi:hypothetical protein
MFTLNAAELALTAVTVFLSVSTLLIGLRVRIPARVFLLMAVGLAVSNAWVFGWISCLVSLVVGSFFLVGAAYAGGALPRRTTFPLVITIVGLPWFLWWIPALGIAIAGVTAAWQLRQAAGSGYVPMVAWETLAALGYRGGAPLSPDLSRIPQTDDTAEGSVGAASRKKLPLAWFLIPGELVGLVALLLINFVG